MCADNSKEPKRKAEKMDGQYCEAYVKRGALPKHKVIKVVIWIIAFGAFAAGLFGLGAIGFIASVVIVLIGVFVTPSFNVDFEYVYVDGQIDFDRITSGERRKTMLRVDLDNIEVMAPMSSHRMDQFKNRQGLTKHDFTSGQSPENVYGLALSEGDKKVLVLFEPSEEMLALALRKAPRKVYKD